MMSSYSPRPTVIAWHITFACQLRCEHCYSDSGRRAARKLPREQLLRVVDAFVAMGVKAVLIGGGEPLLVPELFELIERLNSNGIFVGCYTNGILLTDEKAHAFAKLGTQVHVSIDGATAAVNDAIRGRGGSFEKAMLGLRTLDKVAAERRGNGESKLRFGFEVVLVRSNFSQLEQFCTEIAPQFPELTFIQFCGVIPGGMASRESFVRHEMLSEEQFAFLAMPERAELLRELAPKGIEFVSMMDNLYRQLHSEQEEKAWYRTKRVMSVEPDGAVKGIETYEGEVGNILQDSPELLWQRCQERATHPEFVKQLTGIRGPDEWASAVRRLDETFASPKDLLRLKRRPEFVPGPPAKSLRP